MTRAYALGALLAVSTGSVSCFDLDSFVLNPRQCSTIDTSPTSPVCAENKMCTPCDQPLPFAAHGIPPESVKQLTVDVGGGITNDAYFIEGTGERDDIVIVYTHGNFGGIEHYLNRVGLLYQTGADLFVIDYRSFGKSSTTVEPTELEFNADLVHMKDTLLPLLRPDQRLVVYGFSSGALAATEFALLKPPCGLLLENPWPSVEAFAEDSTFIGVPQTFVTTGSWDTIAKMPRIAAPYLHLHAEFDETVRYELGQRVFDAAASTDKTFLLIKNATHGNFGNDVPTTMGSAYLPTITDFLDQRLVCPAP